MGRCIQGKGNGFDDGCRGIGVKKKFFKNYLIFPEAGDILSYGSIKVEQRVDESPLFLVDVPAGTHANAVMPMSKDGR